jgi:hypothetical protein
MKAFRFFACLVVMAFVLAPAYSTFAQDEPAVAQEEPAIEEKPQVLVDEVLADKAATDMAMRKIAEHPKMRQIMTDKLRMDDRASHKMPMEKEEGSKPKREKKVTSEEMKKKVNALLSNKENANLLMEEISNNEKHRDRMMEVLQMTRKVQPEKPEKPAKPEKPEPVAEE